MSSVSYDKDVHTEHGCAKHGCKYGDEECTVATAQKPQSYLCEDCEWEISDRSKEETDGALWRKHKHLFPLALAILEAASPLVLSKLKFQQAAEDAKK